MFYLCKLKRKQGKMPLNYISSSDERQNKADYGVATHDSTSVRKFYRCVAGIAEQHLQRQDPSYSQYSGSHQEEDSHYQYRLADVWQWRDVCGQHPAPGDQGDRNGR